MSVDRSIMLERQKDAFRVGMRDTGLTLKQVADRMGRLPDRTVATWASGQAEMPLHALSGFVRTFPDHATAMLFDDGVAVVRLPDGMAHDDLAAACLQYAASHAAARHPESEAGVDIGPGEEALLARKAARLSAVGGA